MGNTELTIWREDPSTRNLWRLRRDLENEDTDLSFDVAMDEDPGEDPRVDEVAS